METAEQITNRAGRARRARFAALEAALAALVETEPLCPEQDYTQVCCYCSAYRTAVTHAEAAGAFPHTEDCPWLKARALLGL